MIVRARWKVRGGAFFLLILFFVFYFLFSLFIFMVSSTMLFIV